MKQTFVLIPTSERRCGRNVRLIYAVQMSQNVLHLLDAGGGTFLQLKTAFWPLPAREKQRFRPWFRFGLPSQDAVSQRHGFPQRCVMRCIGASTRSAAALGPECCEAGKRKVKP